MKKTIMIIVIALVSMLFIAYLLVANDKTNESYETRTSQGIVTISLTPTDFKNGNLYVDLVMDTHSVDLSQYNLKERITLNYKGDSIAPSELPILKGHHSSGKIVFNVGKEIKNFDITIKGIPDIENRRFEWN